MFTESNYVLDAHVHNYHSNYLVELCSDVERVNLTHLECKLKPCYLAEDFLDTEPRLILMFGDLQSAPVNYTRIVFTDQHVDQYDVTNLDAISSPRRNTYFPEVVDPAPGEPVHWAPDLGETLIDFRGSYFGTLFEDRHSVCHAKDLEVKYESHM